MGSTITPWKTPHTPRHPHTYQHYKVLREMQTQNETLQCCSTCVQGKSSHDQNMNTWECTDIHRNADTRRDIVQKLCKPSREHAPQRKRVGHITGTINIPGATRRSTKPSSAHAQNKRAKKKPIKGPWEATNLGHSCQIQRTQPHSFVRSEKHIKGSHTHPIMHKTAASVKN